jgi:uncharacterized protein (TIGR02145 family)
MKKKEIVMAIAVMLLGQITVAQTNILNETVTDVDGNVYHTVTIGSQTWLVENLKTTKYNDGTPIPNVTSGSAWNALTTGAWCNYKNSKANDTKYGKLYNWYAVGTGKLAPVGWHVSTNADWSTLNSYVTSHSGNSGSVGKALAATTDWNATTDAGAIGNDLRKNNSTGFSALPGGGRLIEGSFYMIGDYGTWWTSTDMIKNAFSKDMGSRSGKIIDSEYEKTKGLAVRCVKGESTIKKEIESKPTLIPFEQDFGTVKLYGYKDPVTQKIVITPQYEKVYNYIEEMSRIKKDRKYGFINSTGVKLGMNYDMAFNFGEGLAGVNIGGNFGKEGEVTKSSGGLWGYINKTGQVQIPIQYQLALPFHNGLGLVMKNNKFGYINKSNQTIIPFIYDDGASFYEGFAAMRIGNTFGYIDTTGKTVIPFIYEKAADFKNGKAQVTLKGEIFFINNKGERVN